MAGGRTGWAGVAAALAVAASVALSACGGGSSSGNVSFTGSGYPNFDTSNSRHVGGPIKSGNVNQLKVAWTVPVEANSRLGAYAAAPVGAGGVVYSQDLESNVQAIDLESGDVLWEKTFEKPDEGPNGVVVADGRVYGATPTEAFALDQKSG